MSLFDHQYSAYAAPALTNHFGSLDAVTVTSGDATIVNKATAILRRETVEDDFNARGEELKVYRREVDLLIDESLSFKGLATDLTNAKAIVYEDGVNGEAWSVDRIDNKTATFQTILLARKLARNKSRKGLYVE